MSDCPHCDALKKRLDRIELERKNERTGTLAVMRVVHDFVSDRKNQLENLIKEGEEKWN